MDFTRLDTAGRGAAPPREAPPIEAYPSLSAASRLIGVSASTLSRRPDLRRITAGREQRVPAGEVVRIAALYRRRRLSQVAAELAERGARGDVYEAVAREVDEAMERYAPATSSTSTDTRAFLAEARRRLPGALAAEIEMVLSGDHESVRSTAGWSPDPV
jgi:hypothetical protein